MILIEAKAKYFNLCKDSLKINLFYKLKQCYEGMH